jgi:putative PIN family toxin of toxin-antitoxin system
LDTDVVVAALRSSIGASRWLLEAALNKHVTAIVSVPLALEYEAVLTRPEHLAAASMASRAVIGIIDALTAASMQTRFSFRWRPLAIDGDDDMVLETAINGGAELLVTFNVRDFGSVGEQFGCRIVSPRRAVELIRARLKQ